MPASLAPRWRIRLLGAVAASDGTATIDRFGSGGVAALLARLALFPARRHPREELVELLWPDVAPAAGRNRLRQTLFTLRSLLEPAAGAPYPVLVADRAAIGVVAGALGCDAIDFEQAVREGRHADALALYVGELLPGHYDDWVVDERHRLDALADRARASLARADAAPQPPRAAARTAETPSAPAVARGERSPLPAYLTRFFGRTAEQAALRAAIGESRLVTLLGPGGAGKTRLAAETCSSLDGAGGGGRLVLFVPLAGCRTDADLLDALLAALRLGSGGDDAQARIADALAARPTLLVLDNVEQLVDAASATVAGLLRSLAELRVLVTSRRVLGIDGERVLPLAPLDLPAADASLAEAADNPAVGLFVDRARAARTDFRLGERNRGALVELVRALAGLPLALELAASRVRSIAPAEMLAHLRPAPGESSGAAALALLARPGARSGVDARHSSMQRAIEWSWQLLSPALQRRLAELTVFEGGFSAGAAAAVAGTDVASAAAALDELVGHSLLTANAGLDREDSRAADGGLPRMRADADNRSRPVAGGPAGVDELGDAPDRTRFVIDESIRAFAAATLSGDQSRVLRARHRRWLCDWGDAWPPTPPLAELHAEQRNVGAALASALADGAPAEGVEVLVALRRGLPDTAVPASWRTSFARALDAMGGEPADLASRGHALLARLELAAGGRDAATRHVERAIALARSRVAGAARLAGALHVGASVAWRARRDAAGCEAMLDEAEPLARAAGDLGTQASLLSLRAFVANLAHRDLARAEALHGEALALWLAGGDAVAANNGRYNLAVCALRARRFAEVLERLRVVAAEAERQHDWRLRSQASNVEGEALCGLRQWAGAVDAYRQSLELAWHSLAGPSFAYALWNLPRALAHCGEAEAAARLGGAAEHHWVAHMTSTLDASDRHDLRRLRRLVAAQRGRDAAERWHREGAALPLTDVVALALGRR